ncbi:MAG: pentapeptide repeat-containing protein [Planctomycetaceae bacterium]|nr:pentapeptide repeat-containing protein [Planctomycetaceae bacterium]
MNNIAYLFIVLLCFLVALPLAAQDYVWNPGGAYKDRKDFSFQEGENYSGEDFSGSQFWNMGNIIGVNLDNTDFSGSWFGVMSIQNTSFRGAKLQFINGSNLDYDGARFTGNGMPGCDFTDADITDSDLPLNGEQLRSTINYKNKDLAGITIWGTNLSGTSFAGFDLTGARFLHCNLKDCDFTDANITKFAVTGLTLDQLKTTKNYKAKNLSGTVLALSNFDNADFRGFKLSVFVACSFLNADFTDAEFIKTTYREQRIFNSRIPRVDDRFGFIMCQPPRQQFESTKNYRDKNLSRLLFVGVPYHQWPLPTTPEQWNERWNVAQVNLEGWSFRDCNLEGSLFTGALLKNADFTNATINSLFDDLPRLIEDPSEYAENYPRGRLTRKQFESTANFRNKVFREANFWGADLSGIDFSDFDLTGTVFWGTTFTDVRFDNAIISGCTFSGQGIGRLIKEQFYSTACYKNGVVEGVRFMHMNLTGWDFSKVQLVRCEFINCIGAPTVSVSQAGSERLVDAKISESESTDTAFRITYRPAPPDVVKSFMLE